MAECQGSILLGAGHMSGDRLRAKDARGQGRGWLQQLPAHSQRAPGSKALSRTSLNHNCSQDVSSKPFHLCGKQPEVAQVRKLQFLRVDKPSVVTVSW